MQTGDATPDYFLRFVIMGTRRCVGVASACQQTMANCGKQK